MHDTQSLPKTLRHSVENVNKLLLTECRKKKYTQNSINLLQGPDNRQAIINSQLETLGNHPFFN
jgi:hypothetical protein